MTLMQAYAKYCNLVNQYDVVAEDLMWSLDPTYNPSDLVTIDRNLRRIERAHPQVIPPPHELALYLDDSF